MEFGKRRSLANARNSTKLQIYKTPPVHTISLGEFEELAFSRLKLLQEVEKLKQRSLQEGLSRDDYENKVMKASKLYMPLSENDSKSEQLNRRNDHISHYILRLAYCRSEEMRRWFLNQETELLKCRFMRISAQEREDFFLQHKDEYCFDTVPISFQDHEDMYNFYDIKRVQSVNEDNEIHQNFHKVPFVAALDLVRSRKVVLKQGFVYIPEKKTEMIVSLVCNKFRTRISEELVKTLHHLNVVDDDERISPLLKKLKYRYLGEDFSGVGSQLQGKIQISQINMLSKESFPPCMRHLHESLRKEHHLKHFARLQYGLFLKSIGLTLEQALAYWRSEFIKKMEPDKFDKQYAYGMRHSYGKEGKRTNYTAYSCMKIIMSNNPGQGDCHGCPFKHWDEDHIHKMLIDHGISHKGIRQVMSYLSENHFQLACQKYFEITHKVASASFSLEHPSQFFLESLKIRGGLIKQEHPALPKESAEAIDSDNFNMDTELGTLSEKDFNDDMTIDI